MKMIPASVRGRGLARWIDHTYLKPEGTAAQADALCREALFYGFAAVCVHPRFVERCALALAGSRVAVDAVVGFPFGTQPTSCKVFEAAHALDHGATELDMVLAIGALKEGCRREVERDIAAVVAVAGPSVPVKVILETHLLSRAEKVLACRIAKAAGAAFVKTSTGFTGGGATVEDIRLMRATVGPRMGVKASGGVRTLASAREMIRAGANRIGTSSGVAIVTGS